MAITKRERAELVYAEVQISRCEHEAMARGDAFLAHLLRMARLEIEIRLGRRKAETIDEVIRKL